MSTAPQATSREDIEKAFKDLLKTHASAASRLATRAEAAERMRDQEIVERASGYTVKAIVGSLAELQLDVGTSLDKLSERMGGESSKLGELQRAIEVETRRLAGLQSAMVAAEALALLKQDNQRKLDEFEENKANQLKALDDEINAAHEEWKREEQEHLAAVAEYDKNLQREREQAAEERKYDIERRKRVLVDENGAKKVALERDLAEREAAKERDWAAREEKLAEHADEIKELREKVAGMEAKTEEETKKARERAIASVTRDAKIEAELREKESAANVEVFELQIKTLEERIATQTTEITDLKSRLAEARDRVQQLAVDALKSSSKG